MQKVFNIVLASLFLLLSGLILAGCQRGGGDKHVNELPIAKLSNIPPSNDTITAGNPRLTLFWVGNDGDGYIAGYRYRWSYTSGSQVVNGKPVGGQVFHHQWNNIINIMLGKLALLIDTSDQNPGDVFKVYHFFATLPPEGLDSTRSNALYRGDTLTIEGVRVYASNPDPVAFPVHINPTSGTFIFDSQDSLNIHTFEVAAIDDQGALGPADHVAFITPKVAPPKTQMVSGAPKHDTTFVSDKVTDTFPGLNFTFIATDPNSRTIEYSWRVDNANWTEWSSATSVNVTAADFSIDTAPGGPNGDYNNRFAVRHQFRVRSKNEFGAIDTSLSYVTATGAIDSAVWSFVTRYPNFLRAGYQRKVLVVNKSYNWARDPKGSDHVHGVYPDTGMIETYYRNMLAAIGRTNYTFVNAGDTFPTRAFLSDYSTMVIIADAIDSTVGWLGNVPFGKTLNSHAFAEGQTEAIIHDYCYMGGNIIVSSWNLFYAANCTRDPLFSLDIHAEQPLVFSCIEDSISFVTIGGGEIRTNPPGSNVHLSLLWGAKPAPAASGYPTVIVDTTKLDPNWKLRGNRGLDYIYSLQPRGFAEDLYSFESEHGNTCFDGLSLGTRYQGITFSAIYFGFPLYHMDQATAGQALKQALADCGE